MERYVGSQRHTPLPRFDENDRSESAPPAFDLERGLFIEVIGYGPGDPDEMYAFFMFF